MNVFLFGRACSGKTTVARLLGEHAAMRRFSLADAIKREIEQRLGRAPTRNDRALMIDVGQTYKRLFGPNVWVDALRNDSHFVVWMRYGRAVIDDGRFCVEYARFVKDEGFVPVLVVASDDIRRQRMIDRDGYDQVDVIGNAEDEVDEMAPMFTIVNDGSMESLEAQVMTLIDALDEMGR